MIELAYVSRAVEGFMGPDLRRLLEHARRTNSSRGVTGMLVYHNMSFLQVIEGTPRSIDPLFEKISRDPRHTCVRILYRRPLTERNFSQWSMGFCFPEGGLDDVEGVEDLRTPPENWQSVKIDSLDAPLAYRLLARFREKA